MEHQTDSERPEAAGAVWGASIVRSPEYIAEQRRRNAEALNWLHNMATPGNRTRREPLWKRLLRKLLP